jgi:hypothetical protein
MRRYLRHGLLRFVLLGATAVTLAVPAQSAAATTFGADLNRVPDNVVGCNEYFLTVSFGTVSSPSCSFGSQNLGTGENGFPPAGRGVITKVRVRVGPVTGPMQIVVEEALRADNPVDPGRPTYACCKAVDASPVFTPTPNAITEVKVRLPIRQDIAPDPATGNYVDQHLVLSVLAPDVPIPASEDPNAVFGGRTPAWAVGEERVDSWGGQGYTVLFNADWRSCGKAGKSKSAAAVAESAKRKGKKKRSGCRKKKKKKKRK